MIRLALATARLTRLITEDTITEDLRSRFSDLHPMADELVHCRWCSGIWAAGTVLAVNRVAPSLVTTLAVAQAGTTFLYLAERIELQ